MIHYPAVMSEDDTIRRLAAGASIARFGDGELRVARGGQCVSQVADRALANELCKILRTEDPALIVGIPNLASGTPKGENWRDYAHSRYVGLYKPGYVYGSSFITRPDSAPWIDRPDYWQAVRDLWRDRPVLLIAGTEKSLNASDFGNARRVVRYDAPRRDAYAVVGEIEAAAVAFAAACRGRGETDPLIIACCGCAATVLAARLSVRGLQCLDLGHMGMFMRHAGAYAARLDDLASPEYRRQLVAKHQSTRWGKSGHSHLADLSAWRTMIGAESVLDYGCGQGTLKTHAPFKVQEYDPGIPGKDVLPKPADLVVCTDVLEHVEPDRVDQVLAHIRRLAGKGVYLVISCRPARELLPDGRNAHLTVQPESWWLERLQSAGFKIEGHEVRKGLVVWAR